METPNPGRPSELSDPKDCLSGCRATATLPTHRSFLPTLPTTHPPRTPVLLPFWLAALGPCRWTAFCPEGHSQRTDQSSSQLGLSVLLPPCGHIFFLAQPQNTLNLLTKAQRKDLPSNIYLEVINTKMALRPWGSVTLLQEESTEIKQEGPGLNLKYQKVRSSEEEKHANRTTWLIPTHILSLKPDTGSFKTKPRLFPIRPSCVEMTTLFSAPVVFLLLLCHILLVIICPSPHEAHLEAGHGSSLNSRDLPYHPTGSAK